MSLRLAERPGTFVPTPGQHFLLRAALLESRDAVADALARWTEATPFDDIDAGAACLVPRLYRNLERLGISDGRAGRFKGLYRRSWCRNELLLEGGQHAVRALAAADIPAMLLGGAAVAAALGTEHALRPMGTFDVLVDRDTFRPAADLLRRNGWRLNPPTGDPEPHFAFGHAVRFHRGDADLDLHWASAWGMFDAKGEREFWHAARPVTFRGERVLALSPPDQLLQIFADATEGHRALPPIGWAADAMLVLRSAPGFDWDRLAWIARLRRRSLTAARPLEYLRDGLDAALPAATVDQLSRHAGILERPQLALRSSLGIGYRAYALLVWLQTAAMDGARPLPHRLWLMLRFIRARIGAQRRASWIGQVSRVLRR